MAGDDVDLGAASGVIGFDSTRASLDSFPAQLKRLRTKRTRAFTSFNNAAVGGTGGDATLFACEQALQLLTLSTNNLSDTMLEMISRFSDTGTGLEQNKLLPSNQEGLENNMIEITGDLDSSESQMGTIWSLSERARIVPICNSDKSRSPVISIKLFSRPS